MHQTSGPRALAGNVCLLHYRDFRARWLPKAYWRWMRQKQIATCVDHLKGASPTVDGMHRGSTTSAPASRPIDRTSMWPYSWLLRPPYKSYVSKTRIREATLRGHDRMLRG